MGAFKYKTMIRFMFNHIGADYQKALEDGLFDDAEYEDIV